VAQFSSLGTNKCQAASLTSVLPLLAVWSIAAYTAVCNGGLLSGLVVDNLTTSRSAYSATVCGSTFVMHAIFRGTGGGVGSRGYGSSNGVERSSGL